MAAGQEIPGFAFAGAVPDRAAHLRGDEVALSMHWPKAAILLLDDEAHARVGGDAATWPRGGELATAPPPEATFLGLHADVAVFALPATGALQPPVDLRTAGLQWPAPEASLFATAAALHHWRRRHRHCGGCGVVVAGAAAGWIARCPGCGLESYPRTDPAMIVAVRSGDRLLLGRQAGWPPNRWSVLAGFLEPGECLEDTVRREVWEEARVRVDAVRYAASQPWPFPLALMVGFFADAAPDAPEPEAGDELEQARWFSQDEILDALAGRPGAITLSPRLSVSRWLIERWAAGEG